MHRSIGLTTQILLGEDLRGLQVFVVRGCSFIAELNTLNVAIVSAVMNFFYIGCFLFN